MEEATQKAKC